MNISDIVNIDMEQEGNETETKIRKNLRPYPNKLQVVFDRLREDCLESFSQAPPISTDGPYCNRTTDRFGGCWHDTLPGEYAKTRCPDIPSFNPNAFAYRECTENGTWFVNTTTGNRQANYSECMHSNHMADDNGNYIYIFIGGYSLSLIMLTISLAIFVRFRQLRCDRITIHKNLFLSYIFTGISWILYFSLVALDGNVLLSNPGWCQGLHIVCQYFTVCNFLWMFCEGLYLNTTIMFVFNTGKKIIIACYVIGWGVSILVTATYAIVRSNIQEASVECWLGESSMQWIIYGPIVFSIAVNGLFLVNIIRLLITKLRQMPEVDQTRKATKATLILVPLLGLQYLLFPIRPDPGTDLDEIYHIAVALLVSLQGVFVSLMYCFCNSEVLQVLLRKWSQHKLMSRSSMQASMHGTTYTSTDVPSTFGDHVVVQNGKQTHKKDNGLELRNIEET